MSNLRKMIDAISGENFVEARGALKASLAEYMTGKRYVSNKDIYGDAYSNPNEEEQDLKSELSEAEKYPTKGCNAVGDDFELIQDEEE